MRFIILSMLSTNSLAAFSANVTAPGSLDAPPVSRVRATGVQAQPQASPLQKAPSTDTLSMPTPGRPMPRGSLLDLSV